MSSAIPDSPQRTPPASTVLTLAHQGCQLAYRVCGDGPPVLFIQGVGVQGDAWQPQTDALSSSYRCLSFDNRGMGRSQPAGPSLSVAQMADDARALMDVQGWKAAHVVGHSLGGPIALELALSHPTRVLSLALLCTFANGRDAGKLSRRMLWIGTRLALGTRRQRRHAFLELVLPPSDVAAADRDALARRLALLFGHDLGKAPPVQRAQLAAMRAYDARPRLAELAHLPTLVISAAHDPIAPPSLGHALAKGIPNARYVEIPDAAHGVTFQQPGLINSLLRTHLEGACAPAQ